MNVSNLILFIGAIAALIVIHELGHYLACRLFNVEVEEFGLGFPPRAVKLFTWRGTLFSLNWIPLGGFVRPAGENDPDFPGGLAAASPWKRIGVYAAGPLANLLTAALLYTFIFARIGTPDLTRIQVASVNENSPAETAGLLPGDLVTEINGTPIDSSETLVSMVSSNAGNEITLVLLRGEQSIETSLTPRENPPPGEGSMGISFNHPSKPAPLWRSLVEGSRMVTGQIYALALLPSQLISGEVAAEEARFVGYKGMYEVYESVREIEVRNNEPAGTNTLAFFAWISISLGVINLLPIPAVDGGRIAFTLPEIIIRKRIPARFENVVNLISFSLLLLLMIYINVQDFVNPANILIE